MHASTEIESNPLTSYRVHHVKLFCRKAIQTKLSINQRDDHAGKSMSNRNCADVRDAHKIWAKKKTRNWCRKSFKFQPFMPFTLKLQKLWRNEREQKMKTKNAFYNLQFYNIRSKARLCWPNAKLDLFELYRICEYEMRWVLLQRHE